MWVHQSDHNNGKDRNPGAARGGVWRLVILHRCLAGKKWWPTLCLTLPCITMATWGIHMLGFDWIWMTRKPLKILRMVLGFEDSQSEATRTHSDFYTEKTLWRGMNRKPTSRQNLRFGSQTKSSNKPFPCCLAMHVQTPHNIPHHCVCVSFFHLSCWCL